MIKSDKYDLRRLRIMASYATSSPILDIGYAIKPNPFLLNTYCVGYDQLENTNQAVHYSEYIVDDVSNLSTRLVGREFKSILCGELIEHLENPYSFLRDIREFLVPNGRLIISTPNPAGFPIFLTEIFHSRRYFFSPFHTYAFLPRWVERLLDHTGYKLLKMIGVGFWSPFFNIPLGPPITSYQIVYVATPA